MQIRTGDGRARNQGEPSGSSDAALALTQALRRHVISTDTFLAALAAGVPQVLLPQGADQFLNAAAGARGGVAIAIAPDELSVARVRGAPERVLGDADFRTAAQRAQAEISAMPAPEAVVEELERRYGM